ncbi:hypothetical protein O3W44_02440 [Pantoea sp. LMR881]|uniref:hypothetical protein n=1 Tax=Pantoea sp. LMR881 TaxID=3014336 RepID=UPI0022AF9E2F|nr:hypothetical protein [Pantoea sp. LMR881]MCZ4058197.1 hypothetical protein [Pantoea sp. LMR881]
MNSELSSQIDERISELRDALSTLEFAYINCGNAKAVDLISIIGVSVRDGYRTLENLEAALFKLN